jgi:hypothetical protein
MTSAREGVHAALTSIFFAGFCASGFLARKRYGEYPVLEACLDLVCIDPIRHVERAFERAEVTLMEVWPAPGSEYTELVVFMGPEVGHGETCR